MLEKVTPAFSNLWKTRARLPLDDTQTQAAGCVWVQSCCAQWVSQAEHSGRSGSTRSPQASLRPLPAARHQGIKPNTGCNQTPLAVLFPFLNFGFVSGCELRISRVCNQQRGPT